MTCRSKKHCHVFRKGVVPDLLVDSGNPPYRDQARTTAHPTRPCHRLVSLATRLTRLRPAVLISKEKHNCNASTNLGRSLGRPPYNPSGRSLHEPHPLFQPIACLVS